MRRKKADLNDFSRFDDMVTGTVNIVELMIEVCRFCQMMTKAHHQSESCRQYPPRQRCDFGPARHVSKMLLPILDVR